MSTPEPTPDVRGGLPSASSFARDIQCPGNRQLIARIPARELELMRSPADAADASSGTAIHHARELLSDVHLDEEQQQVYAQGIEMERVLVERWMQDMNISLVEEVQEGAREQRYWLHSADLVPLASGQLDVHYLAPPFAAIWDWKAGFANAVPSSAHSAQLRLQALLLWQSRPEIQHIRVGYVRAKLKAEVSVNDFTDYTLPDLQYALAKTEFQLWETKQPGAPRHPGAECRYCPAKAWCKEAGAWSLLPSVDMEPSGKVSALPPDAAEMVSRLTPADLVKLWRNKPLVEKVLEEAVKRLKGLDDKALMDLGLERTAGRRLDPIVNVEGAFDFLLSKGWDKATIFKCMSISKGDVGEQIGLREGIAKRYQSQRVAEDLAEFIEKKNAEPGLKQSKGIQ